MKVYRDFSLKSYNTFGMNVRCDRFVQLDSLEEVEMLYKEDVFEGCYYILSGGSNTLFTQDFHGVVIHPAFRGIEVVEESDDEVLLRVAAGEEWSTLMNYCRTHTLYGLENLVGIPGLVGSAPVQNIGAYGVEVKDCLERVEGYFLYNMQEFGLVAAQCQFGYRDSLFKNGLKGQCLITAVLFRLSKVKHFTLSYKALATAMTGKELELGVVMDTILDIRNSKLPDLTKIGSAGSFFKNPLVSKSQLTELLQQYPDLVYFVVDEDYVKLAAAQLIEKVGWKGKRIGNAGIYPYQALVVVNYGEATPEEVTTVYQQVIRDVRQKFEIYLTPEVNIIS